MPKTKISEYSTTNSANTDIESINIDEGCAPSGINNAIRELMVHLKEFQTGSSGDPLTVAGTFVASGGATLSGTNTLSGSTVMTASAGTSASPSIHFSSDTNTGIFSPAADTIAFAEGGVEAMRIDSSGNLGLGVTPSAWGVSSSAFQNTAGSIWRFGTDNIYFGQNYYFNGTNRIYSTTNNATEYQQGNGLHRWFVAPSGTAGTTITFTQAMTLDASGNLGIGTTSPSEKLDVAGIVQSKAAGNNARFSTIDTNGSGATVLLNAAFAGAGTPALQVTTNHPLLFCTNNTERARIDSSGNFYVTNMAVGGTANLHWSSAAGQFFVTSSSRRFKHDIVDYDKGLAELMQMQPKYFVYNDEPNQKQRAGFIAEDFHDLGMTEYVEYWKDDEGNDTPSEIGYSNMVAILVKAIQELKAELDTVKAELATLKGQ